MKLKRKVKSKILRWIGRWWTVWFTRTTIVLVVIDSDEKMKGNMPQVTLTKPIKPGFRRLITVIPDAPVDALPDGSFAELTIQAGDSTLKNNPASTATAIKVWVNGDGGLGRKEGRVRVDGHVGDGDVEITVDLVWEVAIPDATTLTVQEPDPTVADEAIPAEG